MLPTNTTNIHELTHVIESFKDYVTGTVLNMSHHAARKPDKAEREKALKEAGDWMIANVHALDVLQVALTDFVLHTPELLYQLENTDNHFSECVEDWPEELPTPEEIEEVGEMSEAEVREEYKQLQEQFGLDEEA